MEKTAFTPKYGAKLFKQVKGGPTGLRITGGAAKVRMARFVRKLRKVLEETGIEIEFI